MRRDAVQTEDVTPAVGKDAAVHPDNMQHAGDDVLELYSLHKLEESQLDALEEHLLVCQSCQDRARETDAYVKAVRCAASKLRREDANGREALFRYFRLQPLAAAAAVLLVALGLYWTTRWLRFSHGAPQAPVAVVLQSMRSDQFPVKVPADRPLRLEMDLTGLSGHAAWEVELVDATGSQIWRTTTQSANDKLALDYKRGLEPGTYWIRLYTPDNPREAVREFGLTAE
jgi:hypothetical protein